MATETPRLVSVVVPTYFRNEQLREAVESVRAQTYDSLELVVVDDSGGAHARGVVDRFDDVQYVALDANRGANHARTVGIDRAGGEYVHLLDDDDRMFERKIERQVAVIEENDDVGVVYCGIEKTGGSVSLPAPDAHGDVLERALTFDMWPCMTSTMLVEADLLERLLPLPDGSGGDDLDMMIKLARLTEFDFVDAPLLHKRFQATSRGRSQEAIEGRLEIMEAHEQMYSSFPPRVRRKALARTYEDLGRVRLLQDAWSHRAILAMAKHYQYSSWTDPKALGKVVASLLGRPGLRLIRYAGRSSE